MGVTVNKYGTEAVTLGSLSLEGLSLHPNAVACAEREPRRWLAMFTTFGYQNAYGVFQDFYGQAHTGSASQISWIGSFQLFLLFAVALPSGRLYDEGFFRHLMAAGSILYLFS